MQPGPHHESSDTPCDPEIVPFPSDLAFETLVERHYASLYRFALHLCGNPTDAKDVVQETFQKLATHGHQIREVAAAKSWLFTVAHRAALNHRRWLWRFRSNHESTTSETETAAAMTEDGDAGEASDGEAVLKAVIALPEKFRAPLSLFYLEGLPYEQISEILKIPIGTVMSRLHRGRRALAAALGVPLKKP